MMYATSTEGRCAKSEDFLEEFRRYSAAIVETADRESSRQFVQKLFHFCGALGIPHDLHDEDILGAFNRGSLPIVHSAFDLLRMISDPASLEFPGNYDHKLRLPIADLTAGADGDVVMRLLAAGLLKYMGRFDAAAALYETLSDTRLSRAYSAIGLGDLHLITALYRRHLSEHEAVWIRPAEAADSIVKSTLHWSRSTEFEDSIHFFKKAATEAPELSLVHYAQAVYSRMLGRKEQLKRHYGSAFQLASSKARPILSRQERRFRASNFPLTEKMPAQDSLVGHLPQETMSYVYHLYDDRGTRTIRRELSSRPLYGRYVVGAWPMAPSLNSMRVGDDIQADTVMFTGRQRAMWDPSLASWDEGRSDYRKPRPKADERAVILLAGLAGFYYHFLFDIMGSLALVPQSMWRDRTLIFSSFPTQQQKPNPWQSELLSMLGAPSASVHQEDTFYRDAVITSYPSQDNRVSPSVVRFLREKLACPKRADPKKRIFFTRSVGRTITSDSARGLRSVVEAAGFQCIDPLKLSVRRQRELLSDCGIFMCEAGSGLANILFLPEGAEVITLGTTFAFKDYFCPVASLLNMQMHVVLSDIAFLYPRHEFHWSVFTPAINLAALEHCLDRVLGAGG